MITYHLNEAGDIIGYSARSSHVMKLGVQSITLEQPLDNFTNYRYDGEAFVERLPIPFSVDKVIIDTDEVSTINVGPGIFVSITGPGTDFSGTTDGSIEFSSERAGTYNFKLSLSPYKLTSFDIEVR